MLLLLCPCVNHPIYAFLCVDDGGLSNYSKGAGPLEILDGGWSQMAWGMGSGPELECPTNFPSPSPPLAHSYPFTPKLQFVVLQKLNFINTGLKPH